MSTVNAAATQSTSSSPPEGLPIKPEGTPATTNNASITATSDGAAAITATDEEEDLAKLQAEIAKMEEEAERISKETEELDKEKAAKNAGPLTGGATINGGAAASAAGAGETMSRDGLSIYVGQVEYSSTPEELCAHFDPCGTVERVTIVCDKFTGKPKGYAYLEFQTESGVENAIKLDGSTFKGRTLKVTHKRVNEPGYHFNQAAPGRGGGRAAGRMGGRGFRGGRFGGGRGGRGRGGYRGGYGGGYGGYHPYY